MVQSKNQTKGKSTDSDNDPNGSITSDKRIQSTNDSKIRTTDINVADNKSVYLSNGRFKLSSGFIHSPIIDLV